MMLDHMADESVCELLEVGLGMLARARLGEGLRNSAQSCVQTIVRACFVRLRSLTHEDVERLLDNGRPADEGGKGKATEVKDSSSGANGPDANGVEEKEPGKSLSLEQDRNGVSTIPVTPDRTDWLRFIAFAIYPLWSPYNPRAIESFDSPLESVRSSSYRLDAVVCIGDSEYSFGRRRK